MLVDEWLATSVSELGSQHSIVGMTNDQLDHSFEVYSAERRDDMNALVVAFAIATAV